MKKIKTLFLITFFFSLFSENINAEKSNKVETNKVTNDEVSDQLKKLLDLYKDGVITGYEYGTYCAENVEVVSGVVCDPIAATPLSYRVLAAFFVTYVSMGLILLTHGAKGNWPVAHILLFGITFFALAVIMGNLALNEQEIPAGDNAGEWSVDDSTSTANIAVSALVMLLNIFAYYKMRDEGVEDGMTFGGKDFGNSDDFFFKMYPAVTAVYVVLILIANFVTQV